MAAKAKTITIPDITTINSDNLLAMFHEAKRNRRDSEVEEIEKEFRRRDLIKVNNSLRNRK